jgi:hypothetical protein
MGWSSTRWFIHYCNTPRSEKRADKKLKRKDCGRQKRKDTFVLLTYIKQQQNNKRRRWRRRRRRKKRSRWRRRRRRRRQLLLLRDIVDPWLEYRKVYIKIWHCFECVGCILCSPNSHLLKWRLRYSKVSIHLIIVWKETVGCREEEA